MKEKCIMQKVTEDDSTYEWLSAWTSMIQGKCRMNWHHYELITSSW